MKKKRRTKETRAKRVAILSETIGYDYGCLPYAVAVGSIDFPQHLSAASVGGIAYGSAWSDVVGKVVPTIALVGQKGDELAKAFEEFNEWSKATDPDSVEINFVFRKSGGYVLAISAEHLRLERRCLGFHRTHTPIIFGPTWFKELDTVNPLLLKFRSYCSGPIAPFLFNGVVYDSPLSTWRGSGESAPSDLQLIPGLDPLLKFEAEFIDEDRASPNTIGWIALHAGTQQPSKLPSGPPQRQPAEIAKQRIRMLRCHFPLTLERLHRSSAIVDIIANLTSEDVRVWQIEQATCNLVLSADMRAGGHFDGLSGRAAEEAILKTLDSRHEIADGGSIPLFELADIRRQVIADANALLQYLGEGSADNLARVQAALKSASVLEAEAAIAESPSAIGKE
jgi:hypothetical protein